MIEVVDIYYRDMKSENLVVVVLVRFLDILYGFILVELFMEE